MRDGNYNTQVPLHNSMLGTQPLSMADYERDSQIGTTISQVQRVLTENPSQREQAEALLIN